MDCKDASRAIVLDHYGELGPAEKIRLEEHLKTCRTCAAALEETKRVFALIDAFAPAEAPYPDPERAWRGILAGIRSGPAAERRRPALVRRWAFAAAAVVLVFIAGIYVGRTRFGPRRVSLPATAGAAASGHSLQPAVASHFENLKPILMDYANFTGGSSGGRAIVIEEKVIRDLLLENIVLKRRLAGKDSAAAELFDDLDLILKEISHQEGPDAASSGTIRDLIRQRDVLFKMNVMKTL